VAKISEKIEQLKEALFRPAQRRSIPVIEAEIDKLQGLKDLILARVSAQLMGDGQVRAAAVLLPGTTEADRGADRSYSSSP
jgi:hypothetical protein